MFRVFTYGSTTSFFNAVSASGYVIYECGHYTESDIHSQALAASLNFRVGRPWGQNALIAGWGANDQQFSPVGIEDYFTSSYVGFARRFSNRWNAQAVVEDVRAWRVVTPRSGIAQAVRYAGTVSFTPTPSWDPAGISVLRKHPNLSRLRRNSKRLFGLLCKSPPPQDQRRNRAS